MHILLCQDNKIIYVVRCIIFKIVVVGCNILNISLIWHFYIISCFSASNALMSQLDALLQSGLSAAQRKKIGKDNIFQVFLF